MVCPGTTSSNDGTGIEITIPRICTLFGESNGRFAVSISKSITPSA